MENTALLPPHDLSAEEALLGAVLIDGTQIQYVAPVVKPSDFYHEDYGTIYQSFMDLAGTQTLIDEVTVCDQLSRMGKLEKIGNRSYLIHLKTVCPSPLDSVFYAEIIKRLSVARQLIVVGEQIKKIGFSNPADSAQALNECDERLLSIRKGGISSPILSPRDRAEGLYNRYNELANKEMTMALHTGIMDLDRFLGGGFYNGDVIVIGARAGGGKTTLISAIAQKIAQDKNVLICSAEMNSDSLSDREVAQYAGVSTNRIRLGAYDEELHAKILGAVGKILASKVFIYDDMPMTTDKILQAALSMQLRHGLALVVIDYLGMLDDEYGRNSYEKVGYMSRKIKQIARKLDVPVVLAVQLNRELEKRDDKRPRLFDLRDSGAIEQDADVVLFLYRESYNRILAPNEPDITEIIVAKQRQGEANKVVKVLYDKIGQNFRPLYEESLL
jgi:replicative DNA helicase